MSSSTAPSPAGTGGRWSVRMQAHTSAPPGEVWPLIGEAARWKEWSFLDRSGLERTGAPEPDGVGAVRRFTRMGVGSTEEVVAWEPPYHLGYTILKGFPVRHYRADVTLDPEGSGTLITWAATFDEKFPGTGRLMVALVGRITGRFASGVARYADRLGGHQA